MTRYLRDLVRRGVTVQSTAVLIDMASSLALVCIGYSCMRGRPRCVLHTLPPARRRPTRCSQSHICTQSLVERESALRCRRPELSLVLVVEAVAIEDAEAQPWAPPLRR